MAVGGASAANCGAGTGNPCQCGDTIVGDWTFTGDLVCAAGHGLIVGAPGITINGYNSTQDIYFKIDGTTPNVNRDGIRNNGHAGVVIKNLEITNFGTGIVLSGGTTTVDNCTIHDNGVAGSETYGINLGSGNTIINNRIYNTRGLSFGEWQYGGTAICGIGATSNTISSNTIYDNDGSGVVVAMMTGGPFNTIEDNVILDNDRAGIVVGSACSANNIIENNTAIGNAMGIAIIYGVTNTINNNTANESRVVAGTGFDNYVGCGIALWNGASGNTLFNNTVCHNEVNGIRDESGGNLFYNNTVCFNPIDIWDGGSTGDNNTCSTTYNYDDTGTTGCTFPCPCWGADLVVTNKTERWNVTGVDYYVNYTVCNIGTANSNESFTTIYINGVSNGTDTLPALGIDECYTNASWGPFPSYGCDEIRLWADHPANTSECNEGNNNLTNEFGLPDLVINITAFSWADPSLKTFTANYTVTNNGTLGTGGPCWVNFTCLDWPGQNCIDPVHVPQLAAGGVHDRVGAGPFTINGTWNLVRAYVDWNDIVDECDEGNNDNLRCTYTIDPNPPPYGPCWDANGVPYGCGDVDCSGGSPAPFDVQCLVNKVRNSGVVTLCCEWAGDVDCSGGSPAPFDVQCLVNKVRNSGVVTLDCCEGCECR